jgi:hypothetical protein
MPKRSSISIIAEANKKVEQTMKEIKGEYRQRKEEN